MAHATVCRRGPRWRPVRARGGRHKSNVVARLAAIEAYQATVGALPLRVACVFEGKEEAVSPGIGWPYSNAHAPNESVRLADFVEGIKVMGRLIGRFATM